MENMMTKTTYRPFGVEWEKAMMEFTKPQLIAMYRAERKLKKITTIGEAQNFCEGLLNDFEAGLTSKEDTIDALESYTGQLMDVFWKGALREIKKNPELINHQ